MLNQTLPLLFFLTGSYRTATSPQYTINTSLSKSNQITNWTVCQYFICVEFILPLFTDNNLFRSKFLFASSIIQCKTQNFTWDVLVRTSLSKKYPRRWSSFKPCENFSHAKKCFNSLTEIYSTLRVKVTDENIIQKNATDTI